MSLNGFDGGLEFLSHHSATTPLPVARRLTSPTASVSASLTSEKDKGPMPCASQKTLRDDHFLVDLQMSGV